MADGTLARCPWPGSDPLYLAYHDEEWGMPVREDGKLFEFLLLEGAQAGLSWITILRRRGEYRRAFDGFDPEKIARYDGRKIDALLEKDRGGGKKRPGLPPAYGEGGIPFISSLGVRGR